MPQLLRQVPEDGIVPGLNFAGAAIAAKRLVGYDAANGRDAVALAATATTKFVGVTMEEIPAAVSSLAVGARDVQAKGVGILTAGGVVAIGDRITADSSGKGIATTTEDNTVAGEAVTAASGDTVDFMIRLTPGAHVP
jgi:hypothetical protein